MANELSFEKVQPEYKTFQEAFDYLLSINGQELHEAIYNTRPLFVMFWDLAIANANYQTFTVEMSNASRYELMGKIGNLIANQSALHAGLNNHPDIQGKKN